MHLVYRSLIAGLMGRKRRHLPNFSKKGLRLLWPVSKKQMSIKQISSLSCRSLIYNSKMFIPPLDRAKLFISKKQISFSLKICFIFIV